MNELTYILGAGASYQSIPIVKSFSQRFDEFAVDIMSLLFDKESLFPDFALNFNKHLSSFQNELKSHYSFDTYFKKLHHTSSDEKILIAKKILNLYFLWEHFQIPTGQNRNKDPYGNDLSEKINENTFIKQSQSDKRYDALLAGLIKPQKGAIEFFSKINFVSWNYDLNLFLSVKNFLSPGTGLGEYLNEISSNGGKIWSCGKELSIINMNGFFKSDKLDHLYSFDYNSFRKIFSEVYFKNFDLEKNISDSDAKTINFAWDNNLDLDNETTITETQAAIKRSKTIIVVGYTFPLYNRLVDLKYFTSDMLYGKRLILQDPNAKELENDVVENFSIVTQNLTGNRIITKTNCDNFFIPNDVFSKMDS